MRADKITQRAWAIGFVQAYRGISRSASGGLGFMPMPQDRPRHSSMGPSAWICEISLRQREHGT